MVKEQPCTGIPQAHCRFGSRNGNKVEYSNKASCNLFDSKESCLQFVNNMQHLWSTIKHSTLKQGMPILEMGKTLWYCKVYRTSPEWDYITVKKTKQMFNCHTGQK